MKCKLPHYIRIQTIYTKEWILTQELILCIWNTHSPASGKIIWQDILWYYKQIIFLKAIYFYITKIVHITFCKLKIVNFLFMSDKISKHGVVRQSNISFQ